MNSTLLPPQAPPRTPPPPVIKGYGGRDNGGDSGGLRRILITLLGLYTMSLLLISFGKDHPVLLSIGLCIGIIGMSLSFTLLVLACLILFYRPRP